MPNYNTPYKHKGFYDATISVLPLCTLISILLVSFVITLSPEVDISCLVYHPQKFLHNRKLILYIYLAFSVLLLQCYSMNWALNNLTSHVVPFRHRTVLNNKYSLKLYIFMNWSNNAKYILVHSGMGLTISYNTVLHCTVLLCTKLYCTVLYRTVHSYIPAFYSWMNPFWSGMNSFQYGMNSF